MGQLLGRLRNSDSTTDDQSSGNVTTNNSYGIISRAPLIFPGPKKLGSETIETTAANFTNPARGTLPADVDQEVAIKLLNEQAGDKSIDLIQTGLCVKHPNIDCIESNHRIPVYDCFSPHTTLASLVHECTPEMQPLDWAKRMTIAQASESEHQEIIPGLIQDMALCCLLRCSTDSHSTCSKVSMNWNRVFKTRRDFYSLRKQHSIIDPHLSMFSYNVREMTTQLKVINMTNRSWQSISVPDILCGRPKYVAGVSIPQDGALFYIISHWGGRFNGVFTNIFVKYDLRSNVWTLIDEMDSLNPIEPVASVDGKIYATHGIQEINDENELYTVQAFDPELHLWDHIITASRHRGLRVATVFHNQILFSYVASHDRGRAYHPRSQTWREISQELAGGLRADSCFEMMGCLFVFENDGTIRVYNESSKAWDLVEGDPMPAEDFIGKNYVAAYDNKVVVVNIQFLMALGTVSRITEDTDESSSRFRVDRWTVVEVPENFRGFKPCDAKLLFA